MAKGCVVRQSQANENVCKELETGTMKKIIVLAAVCVAFAGALMAMQKNESCCSHCNLA